jgi:hypothetical protein
VLDAFEGSSCFAVIGHFTTPSRITQHTRTVIIAGAMIQIDDCVYVVVEPRTSRAAAAQVSRV